MSNCLLLMLFLIMYYFTLALIILLSLGLAFVRITGFKSFRNIFVFQEESPTSLLLARILCESIASVVKKWKRNEQTNSLSHL